MGRCTSVCDGNNAVCWREHVRHGGSTRPCGQRWVATCFQENIRFQKSRRRCTSSAALESTGDRVTAAPDGMSQTWSDKLRAGRQSLCGGDTASSTPRGGGVAARNSEGHSLRRRTGCETHHEASSDTLCVGGVSSRTLRGTAAVKESTGRSSTQECSATQRETVFSQQRVALKSILNCREGSPGRSEKNDKIIA